MDEQRLPKKRIEHTYTMTTFYYAPFGVIITIRVGDERLVSVSLSHREISELIGWLHDQQGEAHGRDTLETTP